MTRPLTNGEIERIAERVSTYHDGHTMTHEAIGLLVELARREIQRLNPESDRTPCRFDMFSSRACKYGSRGCVEEHER